MNRIHLLDPITAERIAAGEVVERPASIVKECVENSIDAGATRIEVQLEDGGKKKISITDDGFGMSRDDLMNAVKRHATSKIREFSDLESLATLGFRGEALPSIAAVSRLSILSREKGESQAYLWEQGQVITETFGLFAGAKHGTRLMAQGLFSEIPARLKFLKSSSSEASHIRDWLERHSLAHPGIGFKLQSESKTLFEVRTGETAEERVRAVLADGADFPIIEKEIRIGPDFSIQIQWVQGLSLSHTRSMIQTVNGRPLKDRVLSQALLNGFKQSLLPGQFPALHLTIRMPANLMDVNVHPTKTEVRFLNSGQIFSLIEKGVKEMVTENGQVRYLPQTQAPAPYFSDSQTREWAPSQPSRYAPPSYHAPAVTPPSLDTPEPASFPTMDFSSTPFQPALGIHSVAESRPMPQPLPSMEGENASPFHSIMGGQYLGTLFRTYLLFDLGTEIALIDQHAAHERIRFEKLKSNVFKPGADVPMQPLLLPESVRLSREEVSKLTPKLKLLAELGFEAEAFSDESILFRAVPAAWGTAALPTRLRNLLDRLSEVEFDPKSSQEILLDETLFEKLASEACHSAIRAGDQLERVEAIALLEELASQEHPWNCPHGRPTIVRVARARLEEWFYRRV